MVKRGGFFYLDLTPHSATKVIWQFPAFMLEEDLRWPSKCFFSYKQAPQVRTQSSSPPLARLLLQFLFPIRPQYYRNFDSTLFLGL